MNLKKVDYSMVYAVGYDQKTKSLEVVFKVVRPGFTMMSPEKFIQK
jgi:hypothetical protein